MTHRAYLLCALAGWLLVTWGAAELLGRWVWPTGLGLAFLAAPGLRPLSLLLYLGVRRWIETPTEDTR